MRRNSLANQKSKPQRAHDVKKFCYKFTLGPSDIGTFEAAPKRPDIFEINGSENGHGKSPQSWRFQWGKLMIIPLELGRHQFFRESQFLPGSSWHVPSMASPRESLKRVSRNFWGVYR